MKKKIVCILLACVLCVTALGGCQGQKEPWSLEDFSVYDENGNMIEELPSEDSLLGKDVYTKRGLHPEDPVSKLMELYPLEGAMGTGLDPYTLEKMEENYMDGADLANKFKEDKNASYLIRLSFVKDGDSLVPLEIGEDGKTKYIGEMTYEIEFLIGLCQVNIIQVSSKVK